MSEAHETEEEHEVVEATGTKHTLELRHQWLVLPRHHEGHGRCKEDRLPEVGLRIGPLIELAAGRAKLAAAPRAPS